MLSQNEIAGRMDALGLWDDLEHYNWALKPAGSVLPYFCTVHVDRSPGPVKVRLLLLEGWQTLHDYIRLRIDSNYGVYASPFEMPHFCVVVLNDGVIRILRHDTGYAPREITAAEAPLVQRMLWQVYGVMMRIESDRSIPMRYASEKAMFARVEKGGGEWEDVPLEIPAPRAYVEKITLPKEDVKSAQDLPFVGDMSIELDFRLLDGIITTESRPRTVYALAATDSATGKVIFCRNASVSADATLKSLWESVPPQLIKEFIAMGRVPGRIKLTSGRLFRMVRSLCMEFPIKISLHDSLPALENAFAGLRKNADSSSR